MEEKSSFWTDGDVIANGLSIHYYRTGGAKPPLLLAHGISDNGLCWTRVARVLARDYDLIMVDLRGHGRSDKPLSGYNLSDHAADLAGVIEGLELGQTAVMGHSLGAGTAAILAAEYPQLITCTVLEDPTWFDPQSGDLEQRSAGIKAFGVYLQQIKALPVETITGIGLEMNPGWSAEEFPAWVESKKQVSIHAFDLDPTPMAAWQDVARRIQSPTLVITADVQAGEPGSAIVTPQVAAAAAALNDKISTATIPGAGHNIRREQFEPFLALVRQFLADNSAP
jgi:pimeloyl-ACP methyl ester carboxylesterase